MIAKQEAVCFFIVHKNFLSNFSTIITEGAVNLKLPQNLKEHFKILELIHKTAKTEIWRVEEVDTSKIFVLRIMYRKNLVYKYLATIKHKNLPEIIFVEESESATYVVEEFLNGENLADYINIHGTFDEEKICQIGIELCSCLEKLHACHIIHRDIKPENLFFTNEGNLKLIDFDIARIEKIGRVADTEVLLTQGYAAPEQYGFQQTDERTDIYALGLTLKVLAGYQNYNGFLTPISKKCSSFDPDKRYESAKDLKFAIIRSQRLNKFRKFFAAGFVAVTTYFFVMQPARSENIQLETPLTVEEKITAPEVSNAAENPSGMIRELFNPSILHCKSVVIHRANCLCHCHTVSDFKSLHCANGYNCLCKIRIQFIEYSFTYSGRKSCHNTFSHPSNGIMRLHHFFYISPCLFCCLSIRHIQTVFPDCLLVKTFIITIIFPVR